MQNNEIDKKKLAELRSRSKLLDPIVRIGKNGVNENLLNDIKIHLKKRRLIKIKLLRSALSSGSIDDVIKAVITDCSCILIDRIGLTFSVYR